MHAAIICATLLVAGAVAYPLTPSAFEADFSITTNMLPVGYSGHMYLDESAGLMRQDSSNWGMTRIQIDDYNNSISSVIQSAYGQTSCKTCFLDGELNPWSLPSGLPQSGSDTVNGHACTLYTLSLGNEAGSTTMEFCVVMDSQPWIARTKMDMETMGMSISSTMTFNNLIAYHPSAAIFKTNSSCPAPQCASAVDLTMLIDGSGSISSSDFAVMKQFAGSIVDQFNLNSDDANIAIVQFSGSATVVSPLSADAKAVKSALASMSQLTGGTNMAVGFKTAYNVFSAAKRSDQSHVLVMFTDGVPDSESDAVAAAKTLKDSGIEIYCVGVGSGVNVNVLKELATGDLNPEMPHVFLASSFSALKDVLNTIVSSACKNDKCASE